MKKENLVQKNDYEFYKIPFPLKMLSGKRRRNFLLTELEKLHPCFSSLCTYDYKMKIGKKGFESDVIVMNRFKLAELKKNNGYAGLKFPEVKRKFFVSENHKKIFHSLLFLIFILLAFAGYFVYKNFVQNQVRKIEIENALISENQNSVFEENDSLAEYINLEKDIFEIVGNCDGKISSFEWRISDGYEFVNCAMSNIFPEEFEKLNQDYIEKSSVIYQASIPFFSVKSRRKLFEQNFSKADFERETNRSAFLNSIRNELFNEENESQVLEENSDLLKFSFVIQNNLSGAAKFFEKINFLCSEFNFACSGFLLEKYDESKMHVEIQFMNDEKICGCFLQDLINHLELLGFQNISKNPAEQKSENKNQNIENVKSEEFNKFQKIGEVTYQNGKKNIFYKTTEGKVITVEN